MGYAGELHGLLEGLIGELSHLNGDGQLEGKLNELVLSFNLNKQLEDFDLPKLEVFHQYPIDVTYSSIHNMVYVGHPPSGDMLFTIPIAEEVERYEGDDETILFLEDVQEGFVDNERLRVWVEKEYAEVLNDMLG